MPPIATAAVIIAIGLSAAALVIVLDDGARETSGPTASEPLGNDVVAALREENAQLRRELAGLRFRIDAAEELASRDRAAESEEATLPERVAALEQRLAGGSPPADDPALEELAVEQIARAWKKLDRQRTTSAVSKWVEGSRERLDQVVDATAEKLSLDARRERELSRILTEASDEQFELLDELNADPPPGDEERGAIIGELKAVHTERNSQLEELFTEDEMRTFEIVEKTVTFAEDDES